jgi:hypothetical protein
MPEEIEIPTEHLHEEIQEKAGEMREKWILYVALSTALMAVLAAVAGLLAGHHANEALIERVKASDQWNFYQAKNLKEEIAINTDQILQAVSGRADGNAGKTDGNAGKTDGKAGTPNTGANNGSGAVAPPADIARYEKDKAAIRKEAEAAEQLSEAHLGKHVPLASAVTAFQIAIAVSAIAILTRRKKLWFGSLVLTLIGIVFLVLGLLP